MYEVELKSNDLKEYVYLKLEKDRKQPIYDTDLNKITEVYLNALDFLGDKTDITIYDLVFFKNLKVCYLKNLMISDKEVDIINNLKKLECLQLTNCEFTGEKMLNMNIDFLALDKCDNVNISIYTELENLKSLQLLNCINVNIEDISKLENLEELYLNNLNMDDINEVCKLKKLKYLNLNGSNIKKLDKIKAMTNLEINYEEKNCIYD